MKNDNAGMGLVAVALLVLGISAAAASRVPAGTTNPGDMEIGPIATTLREYIDQGSDPIDEDVANALAKWRIALDGN